MKTKCKILIIDDDIQQCTTLEDILIKEGYSASYLKSSRKALKKIHESFYNVILIDLVLPNISGIKLLKQIKKVTPQSFVIIMTGYATTENAIEALNIGAFAYLIKPLNIPQLLGLINRAIEMQELDQQKLQVKQEKWQTLKEYKSLIDRIAMCVFLIQDGKILFANKSAEAVLGYSVEELINMRVDELISPQDSKMVFSRIKHRLQGKNPPNCYIFKAMGKNNKIIDIEIYSIPTHYKGKKAILCTALDVTEKVRKQKEQEEELRYQTLLNRYTSQLISAKSQKKIFEIAEKVINEIGDEFSCIAMLNRNRSFLLIKKIIKSAKLLNKLQRITAYKFQPPELKGLRISLNQKRNIIKKVIEQGLPLVAGNIKIDKEASIIKSDLKEISEVFVSNNSDLQKSFSSILKHTPFKTVAIFPIKTMTEVIGVITITCHSFLQAKKFYFAENLAISIGISLERLRLIDTLKHSEKRYKDHFEKAVDGIFIINLKGKFVDGNQAALKISGYQKKELVGKSFYHIISPPYIKSATEAVNNLIEGKADNVHQELDIINKNEHFIPLEIRATLMNHKGRPVAIQAIFRDITERKQIEKALKKSEAKYHNLFKHSVDAIFVCDFQGKFIDVNQKACQLTGYSKDELLKMSIPDLHEEADLTAYKKYFKRIIAGKPTISQADILKKDGTKVPCEFNSSVIDTAQALVFHSIARDLSERQKAEQEIHRAYQVQSVLNKLLSLSLKDFSLDEILNRILHQLLSISWLVLESKGAIFLVEQHSNTLVMKAQYGLPKSIKSLCKSVPFGRCLCGQAASSRKLIFKNSIDQPMDNKDFSPHGHYCVPIISTRKKVLGVICLFLKQGHCEDKKEEEFLETVANVIAGIIERKRAEEAVRESEEKYSTLVEEGSDGIVIIQDNQLKYVNSKMSEILGVPVNELIGTSVVDYIPKELKSFVKDRISRRISGEAVPGKYEIEILTKSGKRVPVEINASLIQYKGKPADMAIVRDITERKQTEEALRESEEKYRHLVENINDVIYATDKDGVITYISPSIETIGGTLPSDLMGKSLTEFIYHEDLPRFRKMFYKIVTGQIKTSEYRVITRLGGIRWVRTSSRPVYKDNVFYGLQGLMTDITERKQAEEALQQSKEKYRKLVDSLPQIIFETDKKGKITFVNHNAYTITGFTKDDFENGFHCLKLIAPQDQKRAQENIGRVLNGEVLGGSKYTAKRKDGSTFPIAIHSNLIIRNKKPVGLRGIIIDMTEQKAAEKALRESEERYRKMFESMSNAVAIFEAVDNGKDFIFKEINKAAEETERIAKEEVIGKSVHKVFPGVKDFGLFEVFQRVWRTGKSEHHSISFYEDKRISGWRENYVYKLPSGEVVSIYEDVTRRKNLHDAILKMYLELSTLNTIISSLSRTLSLEEVLHIALDNTSIAADWDGGCIGILEKKKRQEEVIVPYSTKGISEEFKQEIINNTSLFEVFLKLSYRKDSAIVIDNVEKEHLIDSRLKKLIKNEGIVSLVLVPLKVKDRLIGLIVGVNKKTKKMSYDNLALLSSIGQQVGIAIENAQLYQRIKQSEERYRTIFENSQLGIYITTPEGKFKTCNQALAKIDGYSSPKKLIEIDLEKNVYVCPEDMKKLREKLNREGYISNYEIDYRRKDGQIITCLETAVAIKNENGEIIEYHGTIADISQRKKLQEELKKSEEKYHNIFDNVPVSIFLIDADGKIADVNKYHIELIMKNLMSKEEYIGKHILDFDFIKGTGMGEKVAELLKGKNFYIREAYLPDSYKGGPNYYNIQGSPIFANGRAIGAIILLTDVTDLKKLQMELMQSEKLSALGEMISGVAHELNNPLTSVLGYSQLFQKFDVSQDLKEDLSKIRSEAERCHRIVQSLLRFARKHKPGKVYISINEVIENSLELMAYELKVNNIKVIKELDMNLPFIMVDPYQLQQVLLNLINNAYQAMIADKGKGELVIKNSQSQKNVRVSVIDNGPGISQENLPKIFDPFFSTKEPGKGTGLGLNLSYGIIKEHQGEILVDSELGKGSAFSIILPIVDYPVEKSTEKPPVTNKKKPAGAKILVVEDEEVLRSLILQLLRREGYKVNSAENGYKALEMINQNNYHAIISDIKMPRLNGQEFYNRLKQQQPKLLNRVIFLTGDVLNADTNQFLSQMEDRYLTKPFNNEHLLNLIAEVINKNGRI
jgi:PAS domain S-box-containing protein